MLFCDYDLITLALILYYNHFAYSCILHLGNMTSVTQHLIFFLLNNTEHNCLCVCVCVWGPFL